MLDLGLSPGNGMHCLNRTFCFPLFPTAHHTNSEYKTIGIRNIELSNDVLRFGNSGVAAKLCLEKPDNRLCLGKG